MRYPVGRLLHPRCNVFNLGTSNRPFDRASHKAHDRYLAIDKYRYRNGTDIVAGPGVNPVKVVVLLTQIPLILIGGVFQLNQAPGLVDTGKLAGQFFFGFGFQSHFKAARADCDYRYPQLLVEALVVAPK